MINVFMVLVVRSSVIQTLFSLTGGNDYLVFKIRIKFDYYRISLLTLRGKS
jgi:hypothetical protein